MTIILLVFIVVLLSTLVDSFKRLKNNDIKYLNFIKIVYFTNIKLYFISFLILILSIFFMYFSKFLPNFMNIGWLSLITDDKSTNLIMKPISLFSSYYSILLLLIYLFIMPLIVYIEEDIFRSDIHISPKILIPINSFLFAIIHLPMGVSIYSCFILFIIGLLYSLVYMFYFKRYKIENNIQLSNKLSVIESTKVHLRYNVLLVILLTFVNY